MLLGEYVSGVKEYRDVTLELGPCATEKLLDEEACRVCEELEGADIGARPGLDGFGCVCLLATFDSASRRASACGGG